MDKIIDFLNKQTNNKYSNLLFFGAVYKKNSSTMQMQFCCTDNYEEYKKNVDEIEVLCKKFFAEKVENIDVVLKSNCLTLQSLKDAVTEAVKNQNLLGVQLNEMAINFDDDQTVAIIPFQAGSLSFEQTEDSKEQIKDEIFEKIKYNVEIQFKEIQSETATILNQRKDRLIEDTSILEDLKKAEIVNLKNVESIYGDFSENTAYLPGHFGNDAEICIVGNVRSCNIRETKQKSSDDEKSTKKYMSFELEYEGNSARFVWFFPKNFDATEFDIDSTIAVLCRKEIYNNNLSLRVKSIAKCTFIPPKKVWRKCPAEYRYIKPEAYQQSEQSNFFDEYKKTENEYLLNNTFVVYDLETTGISTQNDKIIDIGAYKIVEGKIVEKFCTFVNPECEIPPEASKVNHITNKMVENSPTIDMVLPDFYKFCYGSIIVGYNSIGFDDLFIQREANKMLINFDNKRDDVYKIAFENLHGLHNYKLSTVCAHENVTLIDAHRAANDALATAKLFIKLSEKFK